MGDNKNNKTVIAVFAAAFALSVGISAVAEAQSRSARGVDMRGLQNQQANPCDSIGKLHVPIHPNSDAQGCIDVIAKSPSSNILSIGADTTFENNSTFESTSEFQGDAKFDGKVDINNNVNLNGNLTFKNDSTINGSTTFTEKTIHEKGLTIGGVINCNVKNEGSIRYVKSAKTIQFCDGTSWIEMLGKSGLDGVDGANAEPTTLCSKGTYKKSIRIIGGSGTYGGGSRETKCNPMDLYEGTVTNVGRLSEHQVDEPSSTHLICRKIGIRQADGTCK